MRAIFEGGLDHTQTHANKRFFFLVFGIDCRVIYTRKNDVSLLDQAGTVSLPIVFLGKGLVTFFVSSIWVYNIDILLRGGYFSDCFSIRRGVTLLGCIQLVGKVFL